MSRKTLQHILGYAIGGSVFLVLVPYGLVSLSRSFDHTMPVQLSLSSVLRYVVAGILLAVGLLFAVWSNVAQNVVGEGGPVALGRIEVSPKTRNLVVTGPYRYTRNPMLFGACALYYAVAVFLDSVVALVAVTLFMALMLVFVKLIEEPRLCEQFGGSYLDYRQRTSMFVPWPKR